MAPYIERAGAALAMSILQAEEIDSLFAVNLPPRPYPGLRPFEKVEWPIFFGRERMSDAVVGQLLKKRVLVVHGESGCGKSSLVRAGVLPKLEQESARGGIRWRTCTALPREEPLWNIAGALAQLQPDPGGERLLQIRRALNAGRAAPGMLSELCRSRSGEYTCILIDQFEELFEHARRHGPHEAQILTEALVGLFAEPPEGLYAILTMRSEFLGACARFKGFAEMVNECQYLLPAMGHEDLMRAIREPATLYGGEVSRELAGRLILDAGGSQDQLPLIQHGLMLLHRQQAAEDKPAWRLTMEHYSHAEGLAGLLSDHANVVMEEALKGHPSQHSRLVEDVFRALTDISEGHAIRRPRTLRQLVEVVGADEATVCRVIDAFRAEGVSFLTPYSGAPLKSNGLIDVSHEALLRCWDKLADPRDGWLVREARNGLVWRALLVQAESFERDSSNVLSASTTAEREQWILRRNEHWAERYGGGWERVRNLMAASTEAREDDLRNKRKVQRFKLLFFASMLLLLVLAVLLVNDWRLQAVREKQVAEERTRTAEEQKKAAQRQSEEIEGLRRTLADQARRSVDGIDKVVVQLDTVPQANQSNALKKARGELSTERDNLARAAKLPTRVYIHISGESQREGARALEKALEKLEFGGEQIVVPDIRVVTVSPTHSELRCFRAEECNRDAPHIVDMVNGLLREPKVRLSNLSASYADGKGIPPRQYELWFPPGEISLRGPMSNRDPVR